MTASGPRFALNSVSVDSSGRLEILIPAPPSQWRFRYEGLTYAVALEPGEATSAVKIQARVGTVPYTAENPGNRLAALAVLKHAQGLSIARFVLDRHQTVWIAGSAAIEDPLTPEAMMMEILQVIQEGRPYLRLFRDIVGRSRRLEDERQPQTNGAAAHS